MWLKNSSFIIVNSISYLFIGAYTTWSWVLSCILTYHHDNRLLSKNTMMHCWKLQMKSKGCPRMQIQSIRWKHIQDFFLPFLMMCILWSSGTGRRSKCGSRYCHTPSPPPAPSSSPATACQCGSSSPLQTSHTYFSPACCWDSCTSVPSRGRDLTEHLFLF